MIRICPEGHRYNKTSDCPTCPVCEKQRKPATGFLSELGMPAIRALESQGITSLNKLSKFNEKEIAALHGIGRSALNKLKQALKQEGVTFRKD